MWLTSGYIRYHLGLMSLPHLRHLELDGRDSRSNMEALLSFPALPVFEVLDLNHWVSSSPVSSDFLRQAVPRNCQASHY